jgi:hypothetical protein
VPDFPVRNTTQGMNDKNSIPNLANLVLVLATVGWGFVAIHGSLDSSRPNDSAAASHSRPSPQRDNKVLSRLWQDPFESFDSLTNQDQPTSEFKWEFITGAGTNLVLRAKASNSAEGDNATDAGDLWTNIVAHHPNTNGQIAILGVMLPGGPYQEDKEVRMRLRYAVELALLTENLGPEDATHIFTNSVALGGITNGLRSHIAYEWFTDDTNKTDQTCAVWLNEDDFGNNCWTKLDSLLSNMPPNAYFYLIGPRSSDTLRGMVQDRVLEKPNPADVPRLKEFARSGHFQILSPEASAEVCPTNLPDPFKFHVKERIDNGFHTNNVGSSPFSAYDITDWTNIIDQWDGQSNAISGFVWDSLSNQDRSLLTNHQPPAADSIEVDNIVVKALNKIIGGTNIYERERFKDISLRAETTNLMRQSPTGANLAVLNRFLLEDAYPGALAREDDIFHNWIATDTRLADLIADEVNNRLHNTPFLSRSSNVVAIITEQDTFYGRTIADALTDSLAQIHGVDSSSNVWQFSYLRGLDGSKPPKDSSKDNTPQQSKETPATPEGALQAVLQKQMQGENADGNAQLDYIVRLSTFLEDADKNLRNDNGRCIIAIGITGSDIYDKLILLQALRPKFPEAVFFTTDLDASLWDTAQLKYTRNLLVASACPLAPNPTNSDSRFAEQFAPFRDVYQASVFKACQAAVTDTETPGDLDASSADLQGRLYEIGRNGPVELITPPALKEWSWYDIVCGACYGFAFMLAWGWLYRGLQSPITTSNLPNVRDALESAREKRMPWYALATGAAVGGLFGLSRYAFEWISGLPGEEPWNFGGGVSIWPCEFLRLSAAIAGVRFLWYAYRLHQIHRQRLWCEYFGKDYDLPSLRTLPQWKSSELRVKLRWVNFWWRSRPEFFRAIRNWRRYPSKACWCRRFMLPLFCCWDTRWRAWFPLPTSPPPPTGPRWLPLVDDRKVHQEKASLDAVSLCKEYLRLGLLPVRFGRIILGSVLYLLVAILTLMVLHGAPTLLLIRGPLSSQVDSALVLAAGVPFLLLLFYVLDTSRLTARFLDSLSLFPTRWPENLLHETAAKKGVQEGHLKGWLDVDFAAVQTEEVGKLMLFPFLVLLLIIISRNSYFDDWTWPLGLSAIFAVDFLLAGTCWAVVRRSARAVQKAALNELTGHIDTVKASCQPTFDVPTPEGLNTYNMSVRLGAPLTRILTSSLSKEEYLRRLKSLRKKMADERRGAYSPWIQDPTYLALFVPTGITGILTVLAEFLLNK